jgi:hypothetical protein
MTTRSATLAPEVPASRCGTCCSLGALTRPQFFCGQLLSDQDLTDLVRWSREKAALQRFRDGWGVVCGLDVHCDAACAGGVVVDPGYAVSCCGDDIVVDASCDPDTRCIDLTPWCDAEDDACEDPYAPAPPDDEQQEKRGGPEARLLRGGALESAYPLGEPRELRAVDVAIRYRESSGDPQETLARDDCGKPAECHDTRTNESFGLVARAVAPASDPVAAAAARWATGYADCTKVLRAFKDDFAELEAPRVRDWLLDWLRKHPARHYCFLHESICRLDEERLADEEAVARLLLLFVLDCRHTYLNCRCHDCDEDHGVPLARVWLRSDPAQGGRCQVVAVDPAPPFRRPLAPACWPAPLGMVNVGQVIGHREEEACTRLADLGVEVVDTDDFEPPATVAELETELDCAPFVACAAKPRMQVINLGQELGRRVLGFCGQGRRTATKGRSRRAAR